MDHKVETSDIAASEAKARAIIASTIANEKYRFLRRFKSALLFGATRIRWNLDLLSQTNVSGWAFDSKNSKRQIYILVKIDNNLIAEQPANLPRFDVDDDLEWNQCGFSIDFHEPIRLKEPVESKTFQIIASGISNTIIGEYAVESLRNVDFSCSDKPAKYSNSASYIESANIKQNDCFAAGRGFVGDADDKLIKPSAFAEKEKKQIAAALIMALIGREASQDEIGYYGNKISDLYSMLEIVSEISTSFGFFEEAFAIPNVRQSAVAQIIPAMVGRPASQDELGYYGELLNSTRNIGALIGEIINSQEFIAHQQFDAAPNKFAEMLENVLRAEMLISGINLNSSRRIPGRGSVTPADVKMLLLSRFADLD